MKIWIVLPAYNESENIPAIFDGISQVLEDAYRLEATVIIVDDASTDNTCEVVELIKGDLAVELIRNEQNMGLAGTFMRGMQHAADCADDRDVIVCMDADNTHLPGQMMRMVRNIQEGRDVVVASRYQAGAVVRGVPLFRRFLSYGMSVLFRMVYPITNIRDYSCGYRAYRAALLKKAIRAYGQQLFQSEGFSCMVGILLKLHKLDAICGEVPIILCYDRKEGVSKMRVSRTVWNTLRVLLRERFSGKAAVKPAS